MTRLETTAWTTSDHVAVISAVAALPGLPPPVGLADRYSPRPVTAAWLMDAPTNTRHAYYRDLSLWLSWCAAASVDPLTARPADAAAWKSGLTGVRRTLARRLAGVSSWYRYLVANGVCQHNPFATTTRPSVHRDTSPTVGLTAADAAAILDAADQAAQNPSGRTTPEAALRDAAMLRILFDTGMRIGSLLGADISDLTLDTGHRVLRYVNKGGHAKRAVLPPHCAVLLDRYLATRATRHGVPVTELTGPLLATVPHRQRPGDGPLDRQHARRVLRRLARHAGIPAADHLTPHTARRTYVTMALDAGVPLDRVQADVGHQDPRTTMGYRDDRNALHSSSAYTVAGELDRRQHHPHNSRNT